MNQRRRQQFQPQRLRPAAPLLLFLLVAAVLVIGVAVLFPDKSNSWIETVRQGLNNLGDSESRVASPEKGPPSDNENAVSNTMPTPAVTPASIDPSSSGESTLPQLPPPSSFQPTKAPGFILTPTLVPTSSPQLTMTPRSTPTPTLVPAADPNRDLKELMLGLINEERGKLGLAPVDLGDNIAAQLHAQDMLDHCFISHWGRDGLKPYMRYALHGGEQYSAENVSGGVFCPENRRATTTTGSVMEAHQGLMNSPGHRRNILRPEHRKISLGIACDKFGDCTVDQLFSGDYVQFASHPMIDQQGVLTMQGRLHSGAHYNQGSIVQVWYDEWPRDLSIQVLLKTCSYATGQVPVVFIREPAPPGLYYSEDYVNWAWEQRSVDPYKLDEASAPTMSDSCNVARGASQRVDYLDATRFEFTGDSFYLEADLSKYLASYGAGVYTVMVWAQVPDIPNSSPFAVIQHPIFVP